MTEVQPASMQRLMVSRSVQWSRWSATGTSASAASPCTHWAMGRWPQSRMVLVDSWMMTGASSSWAAPTMARALL